MVTACGYYHPTAQAHRSKAISREMMSCPAGPVTHSTCSCSGPFCLLFGSSALPGCQRISDSTLVETILLKTYILPKNKLDPHNPPNQYSKNLKWKYFEMWVFLVKHVPQWNTAAVLPFFSFFSFSFPSLLSSLLFAFLADRENFLNCCSNSGLKLQGTSQPPKQAELLDQKPYLTPTDSFKWAATTHSRSPSFQHALTFKNALR